MADAPSIPFTRQHQVSRTEGDWIQKTLRYGLKAASMSCRVTNSDNKKGRRILARAVMHLVAGRRVAAERNRDYPSNFLRTLSILVSLDLAMGRDARVHPTAVVSGISLVHKGLAEPPIFTTIVD
jgi:hypothetical protein